MENFPKKTDITQCAEKMSFINVKLNVRHSLNIMLGLLFFMPCLAFSETISYSTEFCAKESKRMGKTLGTMATMTTNTGILKENNINTEEERLKYVAMVPGFISKTLDINFKKWADQEQKEERPFWKKWSNFQKLIGADVGEKAIALWRIDPTLTEERYERMLFQQCMDRWFGTYEVTLERPSLPSLQTAPESSQRPTIIQQQSVPSQPMGQSLNKCQQDGGTLICFNNPSDVRMPRQGRTPYQ